MTGSTVDAHPRRLGTTALAPLACRACLASLARRAAQLVLICARRATAARRLAGVRLELALRATRAYLVPLGDGTHKLPAGAVFACAGRAVFAVLAPFAWRVHTRGARLAFGLLSRVNELACWAGLARCPSWLGEAATGTRTADGIPVDLALAVFEFATWTVGANAAAVVAATRPELALVT